MNLFRPKYPLRNSLTEPLCHLCIEVRVALEHLERAVPHGGCQLQVRGALRGSKHRKGVAHVVRVAVSYSSFTKYSLPSFFDIKLVKKIINHG